MTRSRSSTAASVAVLLEAADHAEVDEAALDRAGPAGCPGAGRVEEAVPVEHADDGDGAEVDEAVALGLAERVRKRVGWLVPLEQLMQRTLRALRPGRCAGRRCPACPGSSRRRSRVVGLAPQVHLAQGVLHELADDAPRLVARHQACRIRLNQRSSTASRSSSSRIPGLTILRITLSPVSVVARWVCAMEADPIGSGSTSRKSSSSGSCRSFSTIRRIRSNGTTGSRSSRFCSSLVSSSGRMSCRRLRICPSLM